MSTRRSAKVLNVLATIALLSMIAAIGGGVAALAQTTIADYLRVRIGTGKCTISAGTGSPESAVTGKVCDLYFQTNGASGTTAWTKESGTGNTGWASFKTSTTAAGSHNFLSATHSDTTADSPVKGDLIVTDGSTWKRLAYSGASNGDVVTKDTAQATGVKWATPTGGGGGTTCTSATVTTSQSTSSTTYVDLTTAGPSITATTGTAVTVWLTANADKSSGTGNSAYIGVNVSGATTTAASDTFSGSQSQFAGGTNAIVSVFPLTVTAGSNTFKMQYRIDGGVSWAFRNRGIALCY